MKNSILHSCLNEHLFWSECDSLIIYIGTNKYISIACSQRSLYRIAALSFVNFSHTFLTQHPEQQITMAIGQKNPIFALLWLILLIFIAWPIAGICAAVWIFLQVRDWSCAFMRRKNSGVIGHVAVSLFIGFGVDLRHFHLESTAIAFSYDTHHVPCVSVLYSRLKLALALSNKLPVFSRSSLRGLALAERRSTTALRRSRHPCKSCDYGLVRLCSCWERPTVAMTLSRTVNFSSPWWVILLRWFILFLLLLFGWDISMPRTDSCSWSSINVYCTNLSLPWQELERWLWSTTNISGVCCSLLCYY